MRRFSLRSALRRLSCLAIVAGLFVLIGKIGHSALDTPISWEMSVPEQLRIGTRLHSRFGETMSALAQKSIRGGAGTVKPKHECQNPVGSECNKPDTACSDNNAYCMEKKKAGASCGDQKLYKKPTRCVSKDTKYDCTDDDTAVEKLVCYDYFVCACDGDMVAGYTCALPAIGAPGEVPKCGVMMPKS